MPRTTLRAAALALMASAVAVSSARAESDSQNGSGAPVAVPAPLPAAGPAPVVGAPYAGAPVDGMPYPVGATQFPVHPAADAARRAAWHLHANTLYETHSNYIGPVGPVYYPPQGYPYLNASLYPSPQPNVPYQVGSTLITNQALAPHEMLYPHTYKAMYPPYYMRVRGGWVLTPLGVYSNEHWQLKGTMVKVKYRSRYAPFSMFIPPVTDFNLNHGNFGIWD